MIIHKEVQISAVKELEIEINVSDVLRELQRMSMPTSKAESKRLISMALHVLSTIPSAIIVTQIKDTEREQIIVLLQDQIERYRTLKPKTASTKNE